MDAVVDSEDAARRLGGLPPLKRSRSNEDYAAMRARLEKARSRSLPEDDEMVLVAEVDGEVYDAKSNELVWSRLTPEKQLIFQEAKK